MKATSTLHRVTSLSISTHITPSGRVLFSQLPWTVQEGSKTEFSSLFKGRHNSPWTKIPYPLAIIAFGGKSMKTKKYTNNATSKERNYKYNCYRGWYDEAGWFTVSMSTKETIVYLLSWISYHCTSRCIVHCSSDSPQKKLPIHSFSWIFLCL